MAKGGKKGKDDKKGDKKAAPAPEPEPEPEPPAAAEEAEPGGKKGGFRAKAEARSKEAAGGKGLLVTVVECKGLKGADGGVHVALAMDDEKKKSAAVADGGAAPSWDGGGEGLLFTQSQAPTAVPSSLHVCVPSTPAHVHA